MGKMEAGSVAIQQALVIHFKKSYRETAELTGINPRTVWQHVAARKGSNVAAWENRSDAVKRDAINAAQKLIDGAA